MAFKIDSQNESLLNDIIKNVDVCLKSFGLPAYYKVMRLLIFLNFVLIIFNLKLEPNFSC
jgi:hypothetical protein